jgi:hypothetical protein
LLARAQAPGANETGQVQEHCRGSDIGLNGDDEIRWATHEQNVIGTPGERPIRFVGDTDCRCPLPGQAIEELHDLNRFSRAGDHYNNRISAERELVSDQLARLQRLNGYSEASEVIDHGHGSVKGATHAGHNDTPATSHRGGRGGASRPSPNIRSKTIPRAWG